MTEKKPKHPWRGWTPGSGKDYDPNDPHFNPMHPPKGYPQDALEREWGEPNFIIVRDEDKQDVSQNENSPQTK